MIYIHISTNFIYISLNNAPVTWILMFSFKLHAHNIWKHHKWVTNRIKNNSQKWVPITGLCPKATCFIFAQLIFSTENFVSITHQFPQNVSFHCQQSTRSTSKNVSLRHYEGKKKKKNPKLLYEKNKYLVRRI